MRAIASHYEDFLVQGIDRPCLLGVKGAAVDICYSRIDFPQTLGDLFKFLIRAAKEELLNARLRKALGLQDPNCLQLEQMPRP